MSKQYGLIVPNKKSLHPIGAVRPSIFGADSDSDTESTRPTGLKTALKRQDKLLQEKAVEEDPTVFQYDELYDEMDAKRKESKLSRKDLDKKPKYISKLLQSAERRKREYERRIEREVQKEREAEGDEYKDKESFVTSAYRAKLEEMKKLDELEQREEYLETIGDVKKQSNLDGFYRHLYDQKVLYEDRDGDAEIKIEPKEEETDPPPDTEKPEIPKTKKRKYRKRGGSDSETEMPQEEPHLQNKTLQHLPSNIDADSDFSIDSSDSDDEKESKKPKINENVNTLTSEIKQELSVPQTVQEDTKEEVTALKVEEKVVEEAKPKIDIWKKRTVGKVFDEALKRYFERKSAREAGTYVRPSL